MKRKRNTQKQRGNIIVFMMFAIIPIVLLMGYIFNGGYLVAQKTRLQNATDTSALMEASWTARSLNIMSMNNTALTQAQAITSAGWAMEKPLMDLGLNAGLVAGFYGGRLLKTAPLVPPWSYALSLVVYLTLFGILNDQVLNPLYELQLELKRAIHVDNNQGFAKAATSFSRMNRILTERFPESIEGYSDQLLTANYADTAELYRYSAWGEEPLTRHRLEMPVAEQSFREFLDNIQSAATQDDSTAQPVDSQTQNELSAALASIKDIRDVYFAGKLGTHTNPFTLNNPEYQIPLLGVNYPSLNYFGNFRAQGYEDGTGPFNAARGELEIKFDDLYQKLDGSIHGTSVFDFIRAEVRSKWPSLPWPVEDLIFDIVMGVVEAIFKPLLGTAYESQELDTDAFKERLDDVYQWSTYYGESNYSNSWRVTDDIDFRLFNLSAPPRMWRGLAPGLFHGYDLSNLADGSTFNLDDAMADAAESLNSGRTEFVRRCLAERMPPRVATLSAQKRTEKQAEWNSSAQLQLASSMEDYRRLTGPEIEAIEATARAELTPGCREDYEDEGQLESQTDDVNQVEQETPTSNEWNDNGGYSDVHAGGQTGKSGGSWRDPKTVQHYLELVNWFFEPSYFTMSQQFPLDAALNAFVGNEFAASGRGAADPNWWCGRPFVEGMLCTNETHMYAIERQRIVPEFASDILQLVNLDLNALPEPLRRSYAADRDDWSMVIATTAPMDLIIASRGYGQVPTQISAISQVEVYNSQWFDLFTQTWKAKLTPLTLMDDDDHWDTMEYLWRNEVDYPFIDTLVPATHDDERVLNH